MYARLAESEAARIAAATDLRAAETTNKVRWDRARGWSPFSVRAASQSCVLQGCTGCVLRGPLSGSTTVPLLKRSPVHSWCQVLTAQLNEVNTSFKSALETAADLLQAISTRPRPRRASAKAGTAVDADKAAAAAVGRGAGTPLGSAAGVAGGQVSEPTAEPAAEPAAGAASGPGTSTASKRKATVVTTTTPVPSPTNLSPAVPAPKPWGKGSAKA